MRSVTFKEHGITLINGDALVALKDINHADVCVTDAPYKLTSGGQTAGGMHERFGGGGKYDNSGNFFEDCPDWHEFMPLIYDALKADAHFYSMCDSKNVQAMLNASRWPTGKAPKSLVKMLMAAVVSNATEADRKPLFQRIMHAMFKRSEGFEFHNLLYWDKGTCTANRWYMKNAEYVGFFFKGKSFELNDCGSKQGIYIRHQDETDHPTEKPVLLMQHYICNSTKRGEVVLDPFMGTGTTGVAAIRNGRGFIGIEKDPQWFEVALARIQNEINNIRPQIMDLFAG